MEWQVFMGFEGVPMRLKGLLRDWEGVPMGLQTWVLGGGAVLEGWVACRG